MIRLPSIAAFSSAVSSSSGCEAGRPVTWKTGRFVLAMRARVCVCVCVGVGCASRILPPSYSFRNLIGGYQSRSTWYQVFFDRHFKWMLAVFAIPSVVFSALQVGLATTTLQGNEPFQSTSYGLTITFLVAVTAGLTAVFLVWLSLFFYHLLVTGSLSCWYVPCLH
jgi:uncharacterized membrane protein YagU involved in acid resistance